MNNKDKSAAIIQELKNKVSELEEELDKHIGKKLDFNDFHVAEGADEYMVLFYGDWEILGINLNTGTLIRYAGIDDGVGFDLDEGAIKLDEED